MIWLLGCAAGGGAAMDKNKKLIDQIPVEVRDYLTAGDGLAQAAVEEKYPDVKRILHAPATRAAVVRYLASKEPWADPAPSLTLNALSYLQQGANAKEAAAIHPLIEHPNPWVRLRVYEYMMAVHYPPRDRPAMIDLFQQMLSDPDEVVRVQAARWIKGLNLAQDMRPTLQKWTESAREHNWDTQESYEIIQSLVGGR
ncbi:MAG: HEAT repeat domain-containing protein [Bryobacteraceae bacterium]